MPSTATRRSFLGAAAAGFLAALGGCVTGPVDDGGDEPGGRTASKPTADETTSSETATSEVDSPDEDLEPGGEPVEANATVDREEVTLVPENDTVRYVAARRREPAENGSGVESTPVYDTTPFGEWAATECASVAADRVHAVLRQRLGADLTGVSAGLTTEDGETVVVVLHRTVLDREGNVVSEPRVEFEDLAAVAPSEVDATVTLDGRSYSRTVPVTLRQLTIRQE